MLFKKIDSSSGNVISGALSFFDTPPSNVGISRSIYREILSLNPITDVPIHFKIYPGSNYLDLSHIFLESSMRIEKLDPATTKWFPIQETDKIGAIQAIGATWIKNLRVSINGRETFNSNSLYAFKSYIDLELSYNKEVKNTYMGTMGYFPLAPKQFNQNASNDQYTASKSVFEKGRIAQFFTKLNADIFSSELLMINNVAIELEIQPNDSKFLLMSLDNDDANKASYRLALTSCKLYVKYVELMEGLALDIDRHLQQSPARYGIRRSELKSHYISADRLEFQINLFTEQLPRRIIICLTDADAYAGTLTKSPFNFGHHNVREITVTSGTETTPSVLYNLDFESNHFLRAYYDMMDGVGFANSFETNGISPKHFKNGWAFFMFTMTADLENSAGFELLKQGTTSLLIRFAQKVKPGGIHLIAYGEMDSLVMLDRHRQLTTDISTT